MAEAAGPARVQDWGVVADWFYGQGWTPPPEVQGVAPDTFMEEAKERVLYLERENEDSRVYLFRIVQLVSVFALVAFVAISALILLPAEAGFFCAIVLSALALIGCYRITSLAVSELRGRQGEIRVVQRKLEWVMRHRPEQEVEVEEHFDGSGQTERRLTRQRSVGGGSGR